MVVLDEAGCIGLGRLSFALPWFEAGIACRCSQPGHKHRNGLEMTFKSTEMAYFHALASTKVLDRPIRVLGSQSQYSHKSVRTLFAPRSLKVRCCRALFVNHGPTLL